MCVHWFPQKCIWPTVPAAQKSLLLTGQSFGHHCLCQWSTECRLLVCLSRIPAFCSKLKSACSRAANIPLDVKWQRVVDFVRQQANDDETYAALYDLLMDLRQGTDRELTYARRTTPVPESLAKSVSAVADAEFEKMAREKEFAEQRLREVQATLNEVIQEREMRSDSSREEEKGRERLWVRAGDSEGARNGSSVAPWDREAAERQVQELQGRLDELLEQERERERERDQRLSRDIDQDIDWEPSSPTQRNLCVAHSSDFDSEPGTGMAFASLLWEHLQQVEAQQQALQREKWCWLQRSVLALVAQSEGDAVCPACRVELCCGVKALHCEPFAVLLNEKHQHNSRPRYKYMVCLNPALK